MKRPDISAALSRTKKFRSDLQSLRDIAAFYDRATDAPSDRPGGGGYKYSKEERAHRHASTRRAMLDRMHALDWTQLTADAELLGAAEDYGSVDAILSRARFTGPNLASGEAYTQNELLEEAKKTAIFRELSMLRSDAKLAARIRAAAEAGDLATLNAAKLVREERVANGGAGTCSQSGAAIAEAIEHCDPPEDVVRMREQATELESEIRTIGAVKRAIQTGKTQAETDRERMLRWKAEAEATRAREAAAASAPPTAPSTGRMRVPVGDPAPKDTPAAPTREPAITIVQPIVQPTTDPAA